MGVLLHNSFKRKDQFFAPTQWEFWPLILLKGQGIAHSMARANLNKSKKVLTYTKGQLISKCIFGVSNFFQKTNENTSHSSKNEFIRSFFGRIHSLTICFWNYLTFRVSILMFLTNSSEMISTHFAKTLPNQKRLQSGRENLTETWEVLCLMFYFYFHREEGRFY